MSNPKSLNAVEQEIAGERAGSLGRSGRRLRSALDELARFDSTAAERASHSARNKSTHSGSARERLVDKAGEAFWAYVMQREALGLHDAEYIGREYKVPAEVWRRMRPAR